MSRPISRVLLLYGGSWDEREVSIDSAGPIDRALRGAGLDVLRVRWDRDGWTVVPDDGPLDAPGFLLQLSPLHRCLNRRRRMNRNQNQNRNLSLNLKHQSLSLFFAVQLAFSELYNQIQLFLSYDCSLLLYLFSALFSLLLVHSQTPLPPGIF